MSTDQYIVANPVISLRCIIRHFHYHTLLNSIRKYQTISTKFVKRTPVPRELPGVSIALIRALPDEWTARPVMACPCRMLVC